MYRLHVYFTSLNRLSVPKGNGMQLISLNLYKVEQGNE
jgi:hypothetical protein